MYFHSVLMLLNFRQLLLTSELHQVDCMLGVPCLTMLHVQYLTGQLLVGYGHIKQTVMILYYQGILQHD